MNPLHQACYHLVAGKNPGAVSRAVLEQRLGLRSPVRHRRPRTDAEKPRKVDGSGLQ